MDVEKNNNYPRKNTNMKLIVTRNLVWRIWEQSKNVSVACVDYAQILDH